MEGLETLGAEARPQGPLRGAPKEGTELEAPHGRLLSALELCTLEVGGAPAAHTGSGLEGLWGRMQSQTRVPQPAGRS